MEEQGKVGDGECRGIKGLLYPSRCSGCCLHPLESRRCIPTEARKEHEVRGIILAEADTVLRSGLISMNDILLERLTRLRPGQR